MTLSERDSQVIWHPYTQMKTAGPALPVASAKGAEITLEDGTVLLDAISSWWVNLHGHSHPYIAEKISEQLNNLEHVIFAGFTHEPAVQLAERLLAILPENQARAFYSDNGSTAVEVAIKMAFQYWQNRNQERTKIVAFKNAYHGDTFGAMSVSGRGAFTQPFFPYLFDVGFIDIPDENHVEQSFNDLERLIQRGNLAAFIYEPLVQGAAGMQMYPAENLGRLQALCSKNEVLLIADEVMTGFGRTGKLFASEYMEIEPDIMCFSKGLTAGTLPMGLTTCNNKIYEVFLSDDKMKTFFHGHSFTANPVGCAAGLASLDLLLKQECHNRIDRIHQQHLAFSDELKETQIAENIRVQGTILAFDVKTDSASNYFNSIRDRLYDYFLAKGILLRPLGNVLYILPPFCITDQQLRSVYDAILSIEKDLSTT